MIFARMAQARGGCGFPVQQHFRPLFGVAHHRVIQPIVEQFRWRFTSRLVLKDDNVKVTLSLSRRSIEFFKRGAKKQHVPYQKMIRSLVDRYAEWVGK